MATESKISRVQALIMLGDLQEQLNIAKGLLEQLGWNADLDLRERWRVRTQYGIVQDMQAALSPTLDMFQLNLF